jgi:hypothetical protein
MKDLYRDIPVVPQVSCLVDSSGAAAAELTLDRVSSGQDGAGTREHPLHDS